MKKSNCCNADVEVKGDEFRVTKYHVCLKCGEPCDVGVSKLVERISTIIQDEELIPSIAEDSGQAEWTVGEARKLAEAIVSMLKKERF